MKIKGIDTRQALSKDQEIKILNTLHEAFAGSGNYLEKLFSKTMLVSCTQMIKDDYLPDLEGCRQMERDERMRLTGALEASRKMFSKLREENKTHQEALRNYDERLREADGYAYKLEQENEELRRQLAKHHKMLNLFKELISED